MDRPRNRKLIANTKDRTYVIEEDRPEIGAYLRIYESGKDIADHLQSTVQDCIDFALEDFDVPADAWSELA